MADINKGVLKDLTELGRYLIEGDTKNILNPNIKGPIEMADITNQDLTELVALRKDLTEIDYDTRVLLRVVQALKDNQVNRCEMLDRLLGHNISFFNTDTELPYGWERRKSKTRGTLIADIYDEYAHIDIEDLLDHAIHKIRNLEGV